MVHLFRVAELAEIGAGLELHLVLTDRSGEEVWTISLDGGAGTGKALRTRAYHQYTAAPKKRRTVANEPVLSGQSTESHSEPPPFDPQAFAPV